MNDIHTQELAEFESTLREYLRESIRKFKIEKMLPREKWSKKSQEKKKGKK